MYVCVYMHVKGGWEKRSNGGGFCGARAEKTIKVTQVLKEERWDHAKTSRNPKERNRYYGTKGIITCILGTRV